MLTMLQVNELKQKVSSKPDLILYPDAADPDAADPANSGVGGYGMGGMNTPSPSAPAKPVNADVSVDVAAPAVAKEEPVKAPAVNNAVPVATNEAPAKAPAVDATQPVSAKADTEPKVETYSVSGSRNKPDFDMTFTDGVCVRNGVAYFIKGEVDGKTIIDDIKADFPDVKQIKKLPFEPTDEVDLNEAKIEWKTENPVVNDCWLVPTSRGYCVYTTGNDLGIEDLKDTLNELAEKNNISIDEINGTWEVPEYNDDIRDIKEKDNESSFVEGYAALKELKGVEPEPVEVANEEYVEEATNDSEVKKTAANTRELTKPKELIR